MLAVCWAAGGGALAQAPDPAHPGDLLVVADQPGSLTITARIREGMTERRATKSVTAVTDVTGLTPPFTLRLFLNGWGLVAVAVLIAGFAGALAALGVLPSADFIALVSPLAALLTITPLASRTGSTVTAACTPGRRWTFTTTCASPPGFSSSVFTSVVIVNAAGGTTARYNCPLGR